MAGMTRDVVIVGGGIAGLSAAWRLRHRDVLLLEAGDRLGGRMRSDPCGEYWLNYGAHLFPAPGSLVDANGSRMRSRDRAGHREHDGTRSRLHAPHPTGASRATRSGYRFRCATGSHSPRQASRSSAPSPATTGSSSRYDFEDHRTLRSVPRPAPTRGAARSSRARRTALPPSWTSSRPVAGSGSFALVWGGEGSLIARNLLAGAAGCRRRWAASWANAPARAAACTPSGPRAPTWSCTTTAAR